MNDLSFRNRLQYHGYHLSKSEQRIAEYIIAHPLETVSLSSLDLAKIIGTSNSTVTRFCQKLKYRNYNELQTLLIGENTPERKPSETIQKINFYYQKILNSSAELVSSSALQQFMKQVQRANKILIFGLGSSGLMAKELNMRLIQMGIMSTAITDSHLMLVQSSLFSPKGLIIAISNSGETKEVINACQSARNAGMPVCALTQNNQTALTEVSETVLFSSDIRQVNDSRFCNSQLPLLFLIDAVTYLLLEDPTYCENHQKALQALALR